MKILILSDAGSVHTYRWVKSLSELGNEIFLFSLTGNNILGYESLPNVKTHFCGYGTDLLKKKSNITKPGYLLYLPKLNGIVREFSPQIIHAHYATSYGLLGALLGFHPFILSVWGSDVFSFPKKSFIHQKLLQYNFKQSDVLLSTSNVMKEEINKYSHQNVNVIPFGVDTAKFKPRKVLRVFNDNDLVIGTVKSLDEVYGIEFLIKAFSILKNKYPDIPLKLLIVGSGPKRFYLQELTRLFNLETVSVFTGKIPHENIPEYQNMIDIAVFPSLEESFGVSVIEASACEKPIIASNIGGLAETVIDNCTGILVEPKDIAGIVESLEKLVFDKDERSRMGKNGRLHVLKNYEWSECVSQMIKVYEKTLRITKLKEGRSAGGIM